MWMSKEGYPYSFIIIRPLWCQSTNHDFVAELEVNEEIAIYNFKTTPLFSSNKALNL